MRYLGDDVTGLDRIRVRGKWRSGDETKELK